METWVWALAQRLLRKWCIQPREVERKGRKRGESRGTDQAPDTGVCPRASLSASQPGTCGPGSGHGE